MLEVNLSHLARQEADYPGGLCCVGTILQHRWLLTRLTLPIQGFVAFDVASGQGLSGIIMTVYHIVPISILTHLLTPSAQSRTGGGLGKELGTSLRSIIISLYWIKIVFTAALNSNQ